MTPAEQLREDAKTIERIDKFGKGLSPKEKQFVEDMCRIVLDYKQPMTPNQRRWAEQIDDEKVGA